MALGVLLSIGAAAAARAQQAELPWWDRSEVRTIGHYRIKTDLPAADANALARHLNVMYEQYARRLASLPPRVPEELNVLIFATRADYLLTLQTRYGVRGQGTGGMFIVSARGSALAFWTEGLSRRRVQHVLQHEAFHQFASSRFGGDLPVWVNEGLAEFFGMAVLVGGELVIGQSTPHVVETIQEAIELDQTVPFHRMLTMTPEEWGRSLRNGEARIHYAQAWSIVQFLVYGDEGRYVAAFERYLRLINDGVRSDLAFVRAFRADPRIEVFDRADIAEFEKRWRDATRLVQPGAFVTALERIEFLAEGMLELSRRGESPLTLEDLRDALVAIDFTHTLTQHGLSATLKATDDASFRIPVGTVVDQTPPRFIVLEPDRRHQSARERVLERTNPVPPSVRTVDLAPRDLRVRWVRDLQENTFRYEIEVVAPGK